MLELMFGLIHLILFVWAFVNIWGSRAELVSKLLWSVLVFCLPLLGLIIWWFMGPKKG